MYDAIIVGARCAGSPTAMLLARGRAIGSCWSTGPRFRATPSPRISSGRMAPRSWTAGDCSIDWLATGCPPIANLIFDVGPFALKGGVTDTNGGRGGKGREDR
jgi:hypothetical protein